MLNGLIDTRSSDIVAAADAASSNRPRFEALSGLVARCAEPGINAPTPQQLAAIRRKAQASGANEDEELDAWMVNAQRRAAHRIGASHVQPCLPVKDEAKRGKSTRAFNAAVCERARDNADLTCLASPTVGGGITVDRIQQLFLLATEQNANQPSDRAKFAWTALSAVGQRMEKDGKTLTTPEENLAELSARAVVFAEKTLPVLKSLQVA